MINIAPLFRYVEKRMTKPKIVLYSRVSTIDSQDISNQQIAAESAGWKLDEVYREIGVSGTVPPMKRVEFSKMMKSLPRGSKVVVSAQDRLTRSTKDLLIFIDEIKDLGIELYILQYPNIDCASAIGIMILTIAASISAMELANLKYRVKMGLERTKAQGTILGAPDKLSPVDMRQLISSKKSMSQGNLAKKFSISLSSVKRHLKEYSCEKALQEYENVYNRKLEQYKLKGE